MLKSKHFLLTILATLFISSTFHETDDYQTIKIGNLIWMSNNLDVDSFRNGEIIPEAKTYYALDSFARLKQAAWCYYNNLKDAKYKYGRLYNWYAVNDSRGLAPKGYHVATKNEWLSLIDSLGGKENAGLKLKSKSEWRKSKGPFPNKVRSIGFNALPGGYRWASGGGFGFKYESGFWWTSTSVSSSQATIFSLYHISGYVDQSNMDFEQALSVRCVKDSLQL
jgi:uncharacterized protein (TIGR02145 family)